MGDRTVSGKDHVAGLESEAASQNGKFCLLAAAAGWLSSRRGSRAEAEERARLNAEVLGQPIAVAGGQADDVIALHISRAALPPRKVRRAIREALAATGGAAENLPTASRDPDQSASTGAAQRQLTDEQHPAPPEHRSIYDQLLINDYALGLSQARRAFNVSMIFMALGGVVLILGVAWTIFRADTGGELAGGAIASAAGILTSGLAQLFRDQSAKALKHLEAQAAELRKDVRAQSNASTALQLLNEVTSTGMRERLQAALILQLTGATLPDLGSPRQEHHLNGASPPAEVRPASTQ